MSSPSPVLEGHACNGDGISVATKIGVITWVHLTKELGFVAGEKGAAYPPLKKIPRD